MHRLVRILCFNTIRHSFFWVPRSYTKPLSFSMSVRLAICPCDNLETVSNWPLCKHVNFSFAYNIKTISTVSKPGHLNGSISSEIGTFLHTRHRNYK